jgi:replication factor C large subunit
MSRLDMDPPTVLLWINENLPIEYRDIADLVKGYDSLSKADIFLGRTMRGKNYGLWSYACDLMNGGVATAKTRNYPNEKYNFPSWLREIKANKSSWDVQESISNKMQDTFHHSSTKNREFLLTYFIPMFRSNTRFAIAMKQKYDFTESEIKYLLGKSHSHKLKEILHRNEIIHVKPTKEETVTYEEEKHENIQQSLFDF